MKKIKKDIKKAKGKVFKNTKKSKYGKKHCGR